MDNIDNQEPVNEQLVDEIDSDDRTDLEAAREQYLTFARRMAAGTLERNQKPRLKKVLNLLAIPTNQLRLDVRILHRARKLEAEASKLGPSKENREAAERELLRIRSEVDAAMKELRALLRAAWQKFTQADIPVKAAQSAQETLDQFRRQYYKLLGAEDPAVLSKRRHLVSELYQECGTSNGVATITIETIMGSSHFELAGLKDVQWVRLDGQDEAEFNRLVSIAQKIIEMSVKGQKTFNFRYLIPAEHQSKVVNKTRVLFVLDTLAGWEQYSPERLAKGDWSTVAAPGQTQAEIDELVLKIGRLLESQAVARGDRTVEFQEYKPFMSNFVPPRDRRPGITTPMNS